jgi:hypothetical protein
MTDMTDMTDMPSTVTHENWQGGGDFLSVTIDSSFSTIVDRPKTGRPGRGAQRRGRPKDRLRLGYA